MEGFTIEGGVGGVVVVGKYGCKICVGCSKTKLLICHKGGSSFMGGGGRWGVWGGGGVD